MKRLKGHKPGCRCVGCSPAARKRGLAALRARLAGRGRRRRRVLNRPRRSRKAARATRARARRHKNPAQRRVIGTSPTMHTSSGTFHYPGGTLSCGPDHYSFCIHAPRGKRRLPSLNARVSRVDYKNNAKARRTYGRTAPFRHDFKSSPRIASVGSGFGRLSILIRGGNPLWRAD